MLIVLASVWMLKYFIDRHRRPIYERGAYERFFSDLQQTNSDLWSRHGPRDVIPIGFSSKLKWKLMYHWTKGKATFKPTSEDYNSIWGRMKWTFIRRWTGQIKFMAPRGGMRGGEEEAAVEKGGHTGQTHGDSSSPESTRDPWFSEDSKVMDAMRNRKLNIPYGKDV